MWVVCLDILHYVFYHILQVEIQLKLSQMYRNIIHGNYVETLVEGTHEYVFKWMKKDVQLTTEVRLKWQHKAIGQQ